jgi:cellulose synthase/poly-beta-1,6-N-acetylglucosamine synthase-like glycosyltransferase
LTESTEVGPEISVVVPTYRAESTLGSCLDALARQVDPPRFEVIGVDSSPDGRTRAAAAPFGRERGGPLDLALVSLPERSYAGPARNLGAGRARASRILFLDADCRAAPDLVRRALAALVAEPGVVGGAIAEGGPRTVSARVRHLLEFKESLPTAPPRTTWQLPSACVAFDRGLFERHGGYPGTRASEDWRLHWRLWLAGEAMRFDPSLRVDHLTPSGWLALSRYSRILGRASGEARRDEGLPGQIVVRWPILSLGLPIGRTVRALAWCARHDRRELVFLLAAWPAYLVMTCFWAAGFSRGVRGVAAEPAFGSSPRSGAPTQG